MIFLPAILILFLTTLSIKSSTPYLRIETSALGLRASSREELQAWMVSYYLPPQNRHLFYTILKARYFDYSQIIYSICEAMDEVRLKEIISDLKFYDLPDNLISDCICISAKNGPWIDRLQFCVNPLISNLFDPKDWSIPQIRHFLHQATGNSQHLKTRWEAPLRTSSEKLSVYFESTTFWKTIRFRAIQNSAAALFIARNLIYGVNRSDIESDTRNFICQMILFGLIGKRYSDNQFISGFTTNIYDRLIETLSVIQSDRRDLRALKKLTYFLKESSIRADFLFIFDILSVMETVSTPAIILNLLELFSDAFNADTFSQLFDFACYQFFNSYILFPTIGDTCNLLQLTKSERIFKVIYQMKRDLLFGVFEECPNIIPDKAIRELIPLQQRLQQTLRKNRRVVEFDTSYHIKLPHMNQNPIDNINAIVNELTRIENADFKAYNYPVIKLSLSNLEKRKSFVIAIDFFFDSFLKCEHLYIILEDGTILPNLTAIDVNIYEALGFFLGSAIILQHPLNFRMNEDYFNLIRSVYKPEFHRLLHEIYPTNADRSMDQLQKSTFSINTGLLKAFEANFFEINEIYLLLFPLNDK